MNLQSIVLDYERSLALKAAGFPQETCFAWYSLFGRGVYMDIYRRSENLLCAAPTLRELMEWAGPGTEIEMRDGDDFRATDHTGAMLPLRYGPEPTPEAAVADLLLARRERKERGDG